LQNAECIYSSEFTEMQNSEIAMAIHELNECRCDHMT